MATQEQSKVILTEAIKALKNISVKEKKYGCAILLRMAELESQNVDTDHQQRQLIEEVLDISMNMGNPERRQYLFDNYMIFMKIGGAKYRQAKTS